VDASRLPPSTNHDQGGAASKVSSTRTVFWPSSVPLHSMSLGTRSGQPGSGWLPFGPTTARSAFTYDTADWNTMRVIRSSTGHGPLRLLDLISRQAASEIGSQAWPAGMRSRRGQLSSATDAGRFELTHAAFLVNQFAKRWRTLITLPTRTGCFASW
jgi:hypothetical protein